MFGIVEGCTCGGGGFYINGNGTRITKTGSVGMVTNGSTNRSSLLGEIIAELDDLLGASIFCEQSSLTTNKNHLHLTRLQNQGLGTMLGL